MKTTIKEVYKHARSVFPEGRLTVKVSYGKNVYRDEEKERVEWEINLRTESNEYLSETDEIFAIALARLQAEVIRAEAKPVEDVEVEQTTATDSSEEEKPDEVEKSETF